MGLHRATVVANVDPRGEGRLQVTTPSAGSGMWALRMIPIAAFSTPEVPIGADVWIAFEDDDRARPVVVGLVEPPSRRDALGRDLEVMGDAWDQGHAAGTSDARSGVTPNPYR